MYSIGQLSKKTNISIRTLRYYDEIGLLKPARVAESGYRYYSNEEIGTLRHIAALKKLGFTLASIKELLVSGESPRETRWRDYLNTELEAVAIERRRLDDMEKLLLTARHAFEMKGELDTEDLFLFIQALSGSPDTREAFLRRHFTEREIEIIKSLPDLSSDDPRNMEWAKLMREVKKSIGEAPNTPTSRKLAERIVAVTLDWFQGDEDLMEKYWALIRPDEGQEPKVFGMDAATMDYIDRIVDTYLAAKDREEDKDGDEDAKKE